MGFLAGTGYDRLAQMTWILHKSANMLTGHDLLTLLSIPPGSGPLVFRGLHEEEVGVEPARLNLHNCMTGWIRSHPIDHGINQASSIFAKISPLQGIYEH